MTFYFAATQQVFFWLWLHGPLDWCSVKHIAHKLQPTSMFYSGWFKSFIVASDGLCSAGKIWWILILILFEVCACMCVRTCCTGAVFEGHYKHLNGDVVFDFPTGFFFKSVVSKLLLYLLREFLPLFFPLISVGQLPSTIHKPDIYSVRKLLIYSRLQLCNRNGSPVPTFILLKKETYWTKRIVNVET